MDILIKRVHKNPFYVHIIDKWAWFGHESSFM
jgi:hypothetical protein